MASRLDEIIAATRLRVAETKLRADCRDLETKAGKHSPRGLRGKLASAASSGVAVIAELKKASPSRGLIRADFDPGRLATELAESGAAALSVLTDAQFFQGSLENLQLASARTTLPCLRKDFVIDEFQLLEARANCADAVLLIVAALTQTELTALEKQSRVLGLDVLCEVHSQDELKRALEAGCDLIGINNRDLRTFQVDLNTAFQLAEYIPKSVITVAESGIRNGTDIARLRVAGYDAFLIGESLMQAESPGMALRELLAEVAAEPLRTGK